MFASVRSATLLGVRGSRVDVEVHAGIGLPGITVVGQPDEVCRESRDRVRAALLSAGLPWPTRRVTVNLAPTGDRKSGACLDLAIAIVDGATAGGATGVEAGAHHGANISHVGGRTSDAHRRLRCHTAVQR